ncbi:hypothetical protein [Hymenobacter lucidus]|uniref:Uncharacterized protein n=1 Tax=Hymenobacter lucidus TaxID=2880930 RepID=A0ABS8ARQ7_9BACT|nr:hypothetical protein [Hymenobacter lucidus]MCB2408908.1 hypothetical protein [Hymenobacter lucidus]
MKVLRRPTSAAQALTTKAQATTPVQEGLVTSQSVVSPAFQPVRPLTDGAVLRCLRFLLEEAQAYSAQEVWLTPFFRKLAEEMNELAEPERRTLVSELQSAGCIRIEKREAQPHPFSVIIVNYSHPDVQKQGELSGSEE